MNKCGSMHGGLLTPSPPLVHPLRDSHLPTLHPTGRFWTPPSCPPSWPFCPWPSTQDWPAPICPTMRPRWWVGDFTLMGGKESRYRILHERGEISERVTRVTRSEGLSSHSSMLCLLHLIPHLTLTPHRLHHTCVKAVAILQCLQRLASAHDMAGVNVQSMACTRVNNDISVR